MKACSFSMVFSLHVPFFWDGLNLVNVDRPTRTIDLQSFNSFQLISMLNKRLCELIESREAKSFTAHSALMIKVRIYVCLRGVSRAKGIVLHISLRSLYILSMRYGSVMKVVSVSVCVWEVYCSMVNKLTKQLFMHHHPFFLPELSKKGRYNTIHLEVFATLGGYQGRLEFFYWVQTLQQIKWRFIWNQEKKKTNN